jgi:predicted HicB family RNase H-like nuclease
METLKYKTYEGTVEVDLEQGDCFGRVLFITDLVTYRADSPRLMQAEFQAAVEDYLETCREIGKDPEKPASGTFQVRTTPDVHKELILRALREDSTVNSCVNQALRWYCFGERKETHNHSYTISIADTPRVVEGVVPSSPMVYETEGLYGTA